MSAVDQSTAAAQAPASAHTDSALQPGIQDPAKPFTFTGRVTYGSEAEATIVMKALEVDAELRPEAVTRQLSVEGPALVLNFAAVDMRTLRAAVGTFCDLLGLASRTLEAFGAGAPGLAATAAAAADRIAAAAGGPQPAGAAVQP